VPLLLAPEIFPHSSYRLNMQVEMLQVLAGPAPSALSLWDNPTKLPAGGPSFRPQPNLLNQFLAI
jgi:hypothetical protein